MFIELPAIFEGATKQIMINGKHIVLFVALPSGNTNIFLGGTTTVEIAMPYEELRKKIKVDL